LQTREIALLSGLFELLIFEKYRGGRQMEITRRNVIAKCLMSVCAIETLATFDPLKAQSLHVSEADEAAVRAYVENFANSWNRHDADNLFGKRAPHIDRINAIGGWINDPAADERVMRRLFAGPFSQSRHKVAAERIRFLTPDVALIVIHMMRISVGPTAGPASELGNRALHILVKSKGNWELAGFANVPILTPPPGIHDAEGTDVVYAAPIP
jgi:uncharacterized protein (TIGR02246 family)